ncbi:ABC transporter substrate-binding protein [Nocardioides aurantiacus]|uniref:Carbohydrate ABC transporter substrate-binding protein (CUT1 family) n=1 Tax=Nocardioides aurantiacus TaxID=86796 RepID=A0A3N2CZV3_9ACTN|nr:sugar ABC transporter substrate-binding protein [Nocardioides aurantiacus]ROR93050.1 carbohydrate ABC transporter substrate-binding protein (CUT1 family) [Nocardioides aurantiacus]
MPPPPSLSRRALLGSALGLGAYGLSGCAGLTERVSSTSRGSRDTLTFQTYGTDVEGNIYDVLARRFEEQNRGVTVDVTVVPFAEASTGIDAGLVSGTAPDIFRVDYPTMGVYASTGQLLDLEDSLDELAGDSSKAFMDAVTDRGRVFGIPQHVDTSALVYRPDVLRDAGITSVPDRPEDAWSWEEFAQVAATLRDAAPAGSSAFAVNWQALGAFRWLNFLFQAGGHVYDEDRTRSLLTSASATRALDFTKSFFDEGLVPQTSSTKAATYPDALFTSGSLAMLYAGNFLLPSFADTIKDRFEYAVTYLPRDRRRASELGGNALVATKGATNPELASEFLTFMAAPAQMKDFCEASVLLPTRDSLLSQELDFAVAADLMPVYADQVTTIEPRDVADVTTATFAEVNLSLANELETCFLSGRGTADTLQALAEQVDESAYLNRQDAS